MCAYIIVFMSVCASVHHSVSYLENRVVEHLTEDERIFFFPFFFSRGKETKVTPNDTGLLNEACETTFSSLWIPPLQVNPAVYPQAAPDPFLAFLRSWQEPLTARPSAISQHVQTRFKPSSLLLLFHSVFLFAREVELSLFFIPYEPSLPFPFFFLPPT